MRAAVALFLLCLAVSPAFPTRAYMHLNLERAKHGSQWCPRGSAELMEASVLSTWEGFLSVLQVLPHVKPQGTWLQIGSNNQDPAGNAQDPLLSIQRERYGAYHKVFVEPIPEVYKKLLQNLEQVPNATALNYALLPDNTVAEKNVDMYCFPPDMASLEDQQICSFNAAHLKKFAPQGWQGEHLKVEVTGKSVVALLSDHNIFNVDVLLIDTEGFDYKVLRQFPFGESFSPTVVVYEHHHMSEDEQEQAMQLLRAHCYAIFKNPYDTFAVLF